MEIQASDGVVEIRLSLAEARRLCTSIEAGYEGVSRAEYFIRTGLSEPAIRRTVQELSRVVEGLSNDVSVPLEAGVEEVVRAEGRGAPGSEAPDYWSVDLPGLTESQAAELVEYARRRFAVAGATVDPRLWLSLHLDRATVAALVNGLELLNGDEVARSTKEVLEEWTASTERASDRRNSPKASDQGLSGVARRATRQQSP